MMVNIRKFFYFFISIYLFLSPLAYSEESFQQQTFSFLQLSGMDGWVFKGVNATNTIYLPIMPQWDVENIQLHFIFERAIDSGNPTHLNMYIDDVPFASLELTSEKKIWDVTIPKDRIKKELINLKISNNLWESGYDCIKMTNPAFWVNMLGQSTITYQYHLMPFNPNLKNFPYPFINKQELEKDNVRIYISEVENKDILLAALNVSNALGKYQTWRGLHLSAEPIVSTESQKISENSIWIGTAKNLKLAQSQIKLPLKIEQDLLLHKDGTPLSNDEGIILLNQLPNDVSKALLIITGNSEKAVLNAAEKIRDPNIVNNILFPEYLIIKKPTRIQFETPFIKKNTTLKQLGFDNKIATGIGENFLNYPIDLSHSKQIDSIHFKIKYNAAAILAKNSFLTLKVNDVPVASTSIYQSENKVSTWNVDVDQDLLKSGLNNFSFIYTLHLPEEKCSPDEMNLAWGTIQKDSELNIKLTNKTANFYLSNIKSFITGNVLVVLPKTFENSIHQIENLLNLIKDLSYLDSITLVSDNEFDSSDKKENIIFIGDHLKKLNSMPVSFEQKKLMVDPQLLPEIMLSDETPESIIELIPSPFRNDKTLLVISSPNQNGLSRAFETLTDPNKINLSQGNILLLYPNKTFISFQSQKIYEAKYALSKKIQNKVYFSWLFIILIVIGLVIYFYKKMNRNDND